MKTLKDFKIGWINICVRQAESRRLKMKIGDESLG